MMLLLRGWTHSISISAALWRTHWDLRNVDGNITHHCECLIDTFGATVGAGYFYSFLHCNWLDRASHLESNRFRNRTRVQSIDPDRGGNERACYVETAAGNVMSFTEHAKPP
ncbi:hypothetical protein RB195_020143 [Necator americanus]|uniref:Uncharacterized protein n=1 Tax=Necator americanus TaxID=51031 RepID=A0ABR1CHE8_NECAM